MAKTFSHKIVASKMDILVEHRNYLQTFVDETNKVLQKTTSWLSNEDTTKNFTFTEINKMIEDKLAFLGGANFSVGCEEAAIEQEHVATRSFPSAPKSTDQSLPAGHVHVSGVTGHPKSALSKNSMEGVKNVKKPKRATSAFGLFLASCRKEAAKTGKPPTNFVEFNRMPSDKWKALTADKKKKFESAAAEDKKRYDKEMAIYKSKSVDPNKPKRPPTAYSFFLADFRIRMTNTGIAYKELQQMARTKWRSLTSEDKKQYKKKALEKSKINEPSTSVEHRRIAESYKDASEKWEVPKVDKKTQFKSAEAEDDKKFEQEMIIYKGKSVVPNEPKRPPAAFFVFLVDFRKRIANQGIDYKEIQKIAGEEWRSMTSEDKKPFEKKALEEFKIHEASTSIKRRKTCASFSRSPETKKPRVEEDEAKEEDGDDGEEDEEEEDEEDEEEEEEDNEYYS